MKDIIQTNNNACALIKDGRNESAIQPLHKALLELFRAYRHQHQSLQSFPSSQSCSYDMKDKCGSDVSNHELLHYYPEYDYDEGMRSFSQPFQMCDVCDDKYGTSSASIEAMIFFNLGIAHARIGDNSEEALICFERSLKLQGVAASSFDDEESMNGPTLHMILHNIGHLHWKNARYAEAIDSYSKALDYLLSRNCPKLHQLDTSSTLNCIAVSMFYASSERDTDDILTIFERALALRMDSSPGTEYDRESATIINNCGRVRFLRGEFVIAFKIYEEAYKQRVVVLGEDHLDTAVSLFNMAQAKHYQGHIPEAINFYKQFVEIISEKKGTNCIDVIETFMTMGQLCYDHGDLEQALEYFSRALDPTKISFHALDDCETVAKIFNRIGSIHVDQGNFDLALEIFKSGLLVALESDTHHQEFHKHIAMTLMEIARVKHYQNDIDQCLKCYEESLEIVRCLNDHEVLSRMLIDLGFVHMERGGFEDAMATLEEAITVIRENERVDSSLLPCALNALGLLRHQKGSFTLALCSFLEAIKIYRTHDKVHAPDMAAVYLNSATVYKEIGELDYALLYYLSSLGLGKMHGDQENADRSLEQSASINYEIGMIYKQWEDFDKSFSYLNRSLQICMEHTEAVTPQMDGVNSISSLATRVLSALADLYLQKGDAQTAMQLLVDATELRRASGLFCGDSDSFNSVGGDFIYSSFLYQILRKTSPPAAAAA